MLSGIKIIPREELLKEDSLSTDNRRRKLKRKELRQSSSGEDTASKRDERRTLKSKKTTRNGTWSCSDIDSSLSERESKSFIDVEDKRSKHGKKKKFKHEKDSRKKRDVVSTRRSDQNDDGIDNNNGKLRKEMGLEWMLRPDNIMHSNSAPAENEQDPQVEEGKKMNPKELNPYLQDNGSGYPNDASNSTVPSQLLSSSLVGDGGASWRLKAFKRAKEQAAREGRTLQEVVGERWDSLQELATTVAVHRPAPSHAHLSAIKERKKQNTNISESQDKMFNNSDCLHDVSSGHPDMKKPKQDNLQWKNKHFKRISLTDSSTVSEALSSINKFSNDGSFMDSIFNQQNKDTNVHCNSFPGTEAKTLSDQDLGTESRECGGVLSSISQTFSSNQLAAKVLRLKMKGKHEEAEDLSTRMNLLEEKSKKTIRREAGGSTSSCIEKQISNERKKHTDDTDKHLAQNIMQNKRYSIPGSADDEYDFYGEAPSRKHNNKKYVARDDKMNLTRQILTQKERCQFCFENPSRPKHLVIAIGNVTCMMLPPWEPVTQGHCCILPLQHELATRTIDRNVWDEIRNFKKCLLKMFSKQDKEIIFLETVIELSKQRRHCLIECIPIPAHIAKQAPLYFKKAIDEAEGEWGQHDMKKVIPTSGNLRNVIPENFSYFHVEFGLDRGFVHVIDADKNFQSSFGSNVVRGMLRLPEETMRHHQRRVTDEKQKQAVAAFVQEWEPFDWTRELD